MNLKNICAVLCLLSLAQLASADVKDGFFLGLGVGSDSMSVSQKASTNGTMTVTKTTDDTTEIGATGNPSGDADSFDNSETSLSPGVQLGYLKHFANSDYLWGAKLSYQYVGQTLTNDNVADITLDNLTGTGGSYAGKILAESVQTTLNHQFAFMPFVGCSFTNSYVYLGAGPALFGMESKLNGLTGYSSVNAVPHDLVGTQENFSNSKWVWGGVAQFGMTYYFDIDWFIDANYTYAITQNYSENYSTAYSTSYPNGNSEFVTSGVANASTSQQITNQTLFISINKMF